jgi:hypothetical protein
MTKLFIIVLALSVFYTFLINNGNAQWQPDYRLTNAAGFSLNSSIASNGSIIHVVWQDTRDTNSEIYYKRSTDEGVTWNNDVRLTINSSPSEIPSITLSGSIIHVVWRDMRDGNMEIYYKRSNDNGTTWGADMRITNTPSVSSYPKVSSSGSTLHLVWQDISGSFFELFYKRSSDGGITWSSETQLTTHTSGVPGNPNLSCNESTVHLVWSDSKDGDDEIYYKRSTDNGINWGSDVRLTNRIGSSGPPTISVLANDIHIAWVDSAKVYYKRSSNNGITWSVDTILTPGTFGGQSSANPSIFLSGSMVHLAYSYGSSNSEIYYNRSTDGGISWGINTQISNSVSVARDTRITASGTSAHVIWTDTRHGSTNHEIYYKRNPTGNSIGIKKISTEIPDDFMLNQNYPNPFNPISNIRYSVPSGKYQIAKSGFVTLKIYDVLGKEVVTLVNEKLKPGTYEVTFDGTNYPSGVYFYELTAGDYKQTRKMLLIK